MDNKNLGGLENILVEEHTGHRPMAVRLPPELRTKSAQIDEKIAGLVELCWRLGLRTQYCCEGDPTPPEAFAPKSGKYGRGLAYITFSSSLEAMVFTATAGPVAWDWKVYQQHQRIPAWAQQYVHWVRQGNTVRFPHEDIVFAEAALKKYNWHLKDLIGAVFLDQKPLPTAPLRICPTCGGLVPPSLRKDARYCSRNCQLRGRNRRKRSVH